MLNTFIKQTQAWVGSGSISISIYKQRVRADGSVVDKVHRMSIAPTDDVLGVIAANNAHLQQMGYLPMDPAELDLPLALRASVLDSAKNGTGHNPIRSIEINSCGGMRLFAQVDEGEDLEPIVIGPFDDVECEIAKHNAKMAEQGCISVESEHLPLALTVRATAHARPIVQERMAIEAKRIADEEAAAKAEEARLLAIAEAETAKAALHLAFGNAVAGAVDNAKA